MLSRANLTRGHYVFKKELNFAKGGIFTAGKIVSIDDVIATVNYDKKIRPYHENEPVNITTQIHIVSLGPIDERTFTYEIGYYHRQWWNDPRLKFNGSSITHNFPPEEQIWIPDPAVVNVRQFTRFRTSVRTVISPQGNVYVSQKTKAVCSCVMDLRMFPMDTQKCPFIIESFAFNAGSLQLFLHASPVTYNNEDVELSGYELLDITAEKLLPQYQLVGSKTSAFVISTTLLQLDILNDSEYYDNLVYTFVVKRTLTYYLFRAYAPTVVLMMFNFGSYWLPPSAVPARITLIVTTVLTNVVILQSATEQTVKVKYVTPMQLFLIVNILFILFSIVEYVFVINFHRVGYKEKKEKFDSDKIVLNSYVLKNHEHANQRKLSIGPTKYDGKQKNLKKSKIDNCFKNKSASKVGFIGLIGSELLTAFRYVQCCLPPRNTAPKHVKKLERNFKKH
ncbi:gamma-aminobutyric acid receptor subunit rho-3-like [Hydractinia symbiolongicarpus]|uniref:gamma-aminobutyric acid receptor subunit rho-3-like n=1 Tax=Hydractinia symbiolongicarpus TaxID=13093 RepID=UPI002550129B|nr:gamma-aminobutyric acid receptor subunit rho-3-like [Hydractinia symbiolongicarpus]